MNFSNLQTPGVYINEVNAFPNSVTPVQTSIPAFIGYTPQALYNGKSYTNVPVQINSLAEFEAFFCLPAPAKNYSPQYYLQAQTAQPASGSSIFLNGTWFSVQPDASTIYYLWNSVRLFYMNGGGTAYIVSVGGYGAAAGKPLQPGDALVNPNVQLNDLTKGLHALISKTEITMISCPDANLLGTADNGTFIQQLLSQCNTMQTGIALIDVPAGRTPDAKTLDADITAFREKTGTYGLDYGAVYYPFLGTTVMQQTDIDYTNYFGGDFAQLAAILNPASAPDPVVAKIISNIENPATPPASVSQNNTALLLHCANYGQITNCVLNELNLLPPGAGMAGVITTTDNMEGPWQAPANCSIIGVSSLPINLTDTQQASLNVDAVSGKSINAIRAFASQGILVWGARTLDGNSEDWRYINVRRTVTFIEQSCKLAAKSYIFEPNNQNTWQAIVSMISSFLTTVWQQGGLQGASAADAFSVQCGLGVTMTAQDILEGFLIVSIKVAVVRPAEFIVFTFQQQQAKSG
jgi:phage tail sheath protein FI